MIGRNVDWILVVALALAGCGGGGSGSSPAPVTISNGTTAQIGSGVSGTLSLRVANGVATTDAQHRNAKFVSPGAVSAGISINGGTVTYADVSPTSSLCTTTAGVRTCTIGVGAPAGNQSFAVSLYTLANGGGLLLSSGSNSMTVVAGTPFTVTVGLNPVAAGLLSSTPTIPAFTLGTAASITVVATFADPAGQPITGSGNIPNFLFPIAITFSDPHITATPSTIVTPGQSVAIAYDGSTGVASSISISMTANGTHIFGSLVSVASGHVIIEYPVISTGAQVDAVTAGPDGALWFTEQAFSGQPNNIGRITTGGAVTEYAIPSANADASGITTGPDGSLWFTETIGGKIGRLDIGTHAITEFALNPAFASGPSGIVTGSDNNLWIASGASITRLTTGLTPTYFTIPTTSSSPSGIAAGPDLNLWFTENSGNKIGRISTAGVITEFAVPTASSGPLAIVAGPDGAMWFVEQQGSKVGRITTAGLITEYTIPTASSFPFGITVGADNNLWFTESAANKIGQITTSGVITEFPLAGGEAASQIVSGSDGGLWFAEFTAHKVGRIQP